MKLQAVLGLWLAALVGQGAAQTVNTVLTNRLADPCNIVVEANVYYITDSANHRIVSYNPDSGAFNTLAGFIGRPGSVDGKGVYARFYAPRGLISVPALGGLVVADYANHTLRLVKLDGTVTTLAGTTGTPGLDPGPTTALAAHFNFPSALAADSSGNIFIADSKNNAIRKLDLSRVVSTVAVGFNQPDGIAVGDNGDLWISDSRDHTIKQLFANGTLQLAAGTSGQSGALDSLFATTLPGFDVPGALFNNPGALLWLGGGNGLLVCDTGNHALRRVYQDPEIVGYSVATYAGVLGQSGFVDGPVLQARFNSPSGVTLDPTGGFLIADLGNNALRDIQTSAPQPPVTDPVIGWVNFQKDQFGDLVSSLVPVSQAVFNNDVTIAILAESGTETFFTFGATPPSSLQDTILSPNQLTGNSPPAYQNGLHAADVPPSIISPQPDVTVKAIGTAVNRKPSAVVQARFQFQTGNPSVLGDNSAAFTVNSITTGAQLWYTTDGSDPAIGGPTSTLVPTGGALSLPRSPVPVVFKVRAFRTDYGDSQIISKTFQPSDYQANRITFGFDSGEASSDFVAAAGQTFYAPVTLSLLPNQKIYSMQFNVTVANNTGSPAVAAGAIGFESMLRQQVKDTNGTVIYAQIPPAMFLNGQSVPSGLESPMGFGDLQITNSSTNLLAVGWLETLGKTNLYDTTKQDLITYSIAHDTLFTSQNQKVVVGAYMFQVPLTAAADSSYKIQISRPSATADGISQDNYIEAVTDGTVTSSPVNRINSIKLVTIGQRQYIVGDVAPFRWFNAGDFGDTNLLNNDVLQVFHSAIYGLNVPPFGSFTNGFGVTGDQNRTDFFDAMDSSNGVTNNAALNVALGDDTAINNIQYGDGYLNVDDVYVTFRRALDPTLTWYARYWANGQRQAVVVPNVFRGQPDHPGTQLSYRTSDLTGTTIPGDPAVTFAVDDLNLPSGQVLQIPVRSKVVGNLPLRVMMLSLTVDALDGSPALAEPVQFTPVNTLGTATLTTSRGANNYAGAWLNNQVPGVVGDSLVGYLTVALPTNATPNTVYRVHFDHASASPNGLGLFPKQVQDGLIMLKDRSTSTLGDGIPDTWRLRYFGTVSNLLSQATADADGDGASNWAEFQAGTNPVDPASYLGVRIDSPRPATAGAAAVTLRWPSVANKSYCVEMAPSVTSTDWTVLSSGLMGTGRDLLFVPPSSTGTPQFYRVRVANP